VRRAWYLPLVIAVTLAVSGCGVLEVHAPQINAPDLNAAKDHAAEVVLEKLPVNERVNLLEFYFNGDATLSLATRALDHVNPYPLPDQQKFLASGRGANGIHRTHEECAYYGDNRGEITNIQGIGALQWDFDHSRFTLDWDNFTSCYQYNDHDLTSGVTQMQVTLRIIGIAVVGYAHYMSKANEPFESRKRNISCVAGVLLWALTQPFVLVSDPEPPYLVPAHVAEIMRYVKARAAFIGNRADEGYKLHDVNGCKK